MKRFSSDEINAFVAHYQAKTPDRFPVMEHFYTIQGEGRYAGHPAYFIRLGGCDVGCSWCDVKGSWDPYAHPSYSIQDLVRLVEDAQATMVVITGGEPAIYDLHTLLEAFAERNIRTHIETSGAHPLKGKPDWVTLSPKKFLGPHPSVFPLADELKVIIYHPSDFKWAEGFVPLLASSCLLYMQTEWSRSDQNLPLIIDYIKLNPSWALSLQTHKYIQIP